MSTALPTGTVTFLMSDIEGSTRLVGDLGAEFPRLLDEHFAILGEAIATNGGTIVSSEGDSIFAVFPAVRPAIEAAVQGQRALDAHEWPRGAHVRVRIGIHAGEAVFGGRDYTGIDVHRTARIMAAGHGGQVLVSETARALAALDQNAPTSLRDLGTYRLRDMGAPDRLYGLVAPDLRSEFPPLRAAAAVTPTNLPTPLTRFVGRTRELAEICDLIGRERLVTLTGPGGTGKTRLAIEAGRTMLDAFPDGVWFTPLEFLRERQLVMPTIAASLGLPERAGRTAAESVSEFLGPKRALLVLDNMEQVVEAGPDLVALLAAAPSTAILVASREPLAVDGEHIYPVPPLTVPAEPGVLRAADIADREAVILFVERARAARPAFALTDSNAPTVASIARRLDGLPLALELAAARMNLLSPEQILARLDHRLTLLASSRRDLPDRQRTLRGAIDWSHDLLTDPERRLFRRLSVFTGGADLEAVEVVVDPDDSLGGDVLDLTGALVDRSLIRSREVGDRNRLEMLETIREYAAEQLRDAGEADRIGAAHAACVAALAESAVNALIHPDGQALLDRLELELPNVRSAITFAIRTGDHETALRIGSGLREFWHSRNHLQEGRAVLAELLSITADDGPTILRAMAVATASELASWHGDYQTSYRLAVEATEMATVVGDPIVLANARQGLGWATFMHEPERSLVEFEAAIEMADAAGDPALLMGAVQGAAMALLQLGRIPEARARLMEAIAIADANGDRYTQAFHMTSLGFLEVRSERREAALECFAAAVRLAHETGGRNALGIALDGIALMAIPEGRLDEAVQLATVAARLREEQGGGLTTVMIGDETPPLERAAAAMPPDGLARASEAGRALSIDDAVALALSIADEATRSASA